MSSNPRKLLSYRGLIVRWGRWVPLLVLGTVLLFSLTAAALVARLTYAQQQARFTREISAHTSALRERISDFGNLLISARAFWVSQPEPPTPQRFRNFSTQLNLQTRYPDVQALGFVSLTPNTQGSSVNGKPGDAPGSVTSAASTTSQPYHATIRFIAPPTAINLGALGFDMYGEPVRRAAIQAARQSGGLEASDLVELVQKNADGTPQKGFLLFSPVWRAADGTGALAGQGKLEGFVYLALQAESFVKSLDGSYGKDILNSRVSLNGHLLTAQPDLAHAQSQPSFDLAGQKWQVAYATPRSFATDPLNWLSPLIALLGLFTAGVAFLLIRRQVLALESAEAANHDLSRLQQRQQRARAEFEAIFQAMQDAAAFTDEHGRVRLVNRAMTELFQTPVNELIGHPLTMLHVDRRLDERGSFQAVTTPYQRDDGSRFYGEAQRNEVTDAQGARLGHLEVIRDVSERVSADQALRDEERRSRAILDTIPHILWVSTPLGTTTYVNTQHQQRLYGEEIYPRIAPEDRDTYNRMWQEAYIGSRNAQCTVRVEISVRNEATATKRQTRWFEINVAPLFDAQGQAREWVASATDIHDRLLAERKAQKSEARYRGVVEGMPQIVWLADRRGQYTYFNRRWEEFVGAAADNDLLGTVHPDDRGDYAARWQVALTSGQPFEAEHRLRSSSGEYRTFVTRGLPICDAQGEVLEWVGTTTDVDDSVYAENTARLLVDVTEAMLARASTVPEMHRERYEKVLQLVTDRLMEAACIWTVHVQEGREGPLELSELAASAKNPNWSLPHIMQTVTQLALHVAVTQEPEYVVAHPLLHAVEVSGGVMYPLIGLNGTLRGVLGLAHRHPLHDRDHEVILELVSRLTTALENDSLREAATNAQQELRQLNQSLEERVQRRTMELEEANRELEAFSYSVSHDLRTPLRHIVGFGDLLRKDAGDTLSPKSQRYLGVITEAAGRMSGLIDSLLEFSRMGRQPLRSVPVELGPLAEQVWQTLEPDRQGHDIRLTLHPLPSVPGDPALLELVFQNLLSNAIKYSKIREVAEIDISGEIVGDMVRVSVRDNGVGFDPKYTAKLFGVFQRLHRAEEFEGIGIGLANVRRIISRHGGQVSGESVLGEGATFTVTLPLHHEAER